MNVEDVKNFSEKSKAKALIAAHHVAAEQHDLAYFKEMLRDHQRAMEEDQQAREARAAAKAEKADKKTKRKSVAAGDSDVSMEDADEEGGESKPKSNKKRKKAEDSDGETEKVCPLMMRLNLVLI